MSTDLEALKARLKSTWMAGDFGQIAKSYEDGAAEFVERLKIPKGAKVLDVACGTGNLAIPAARLGAVVTGLDIAPNLVEQARERAKAQGLKAEFVEGDAEDLPYPDVSFDVVMTMFGAMFCPRPEKAAAELVRVCKPGGRVAMANWTPQGFAGQMFKTISKHVPPPPGMPPPVQWGDEAIVKERLKVRDLKLTRRPILFNFPFGPADVVEHFVRYFGPAQRSFQSLDPAGQKALREDMVKLWTQANRAKEDKTQVESEYLEVVGTV